MKQNAPEWQKLALREIQWRALWTWLLAFVVCVAVTTVMGILGARNPPWFTAAVFPSIVLFGSLASAYKRGVADGRAHPRSADAHDASNTTI